MIAKDIMPSERLKAYIQQYRLRHFIFRNGVIPPAKPFPPRPEQCLIFYVRGHETVRYINEKSEYSNPRSVISGQFTTRVDRYVSYPEILMIIVDFKPGALHRLTGIPFTQLTNKMLDAETVFSNEIKKVSDCLGSLESYVEMMRVIELFIIQLAEKSKKDFLAVDHLLSGIVTAPGCSIDRLAQRAYLSPRQLERKFDEKIGISPKTFLRITRFNQSYWMHLKDRNLSWFQIAMSCGYTDYQHLAREYKEFANTSPTNFFIEENGAPGRILGLTK